MTTRLRLGSILLWIVLVLVGTMFGASVYQRIALIPEWGGNLPDSVFQHFRDPRAGLAIDRFWTLVTGPTTLSILVALQLNWPLAVRRRWLLYGAGLYFAMLVWTFAYFIPQGVVPLMLRAGSGLSPDAIAQMARSWIFWDWFRMVGTLAAYLCFLAAATRPVTRP